MAEFILVTVRSSGDKVRINVDVICYYFSIKEEYGTVVYLIEQTKLVVDESPDELDELIYKATPRVA